MGVEGVLFCGLVWFCLVWFGMSVMGVWVVCLGCLGSGQCGEEGEVSYLIYILEYDVCQFGGVYILRIHLSKLARGVRILFPPADDWIER